MKPLIGLTLLLLLVGCSRPKPHVSTWEGGLPEIVIVEQFTTTPVPKGSWTKSEEAIFSETNALEYLAYYSDLNGTFSVSHDKDYNNTWRIIKIEHPTIVMKREGKTKRKKSEHKTLFQEVQLNFLKRVRTTLAQKELNMGTVGKMIIGIVVVAAVWIVMQVWIGWDAT